jgi:hypothetical protein
VRRQRPHRSGYNRVLLIPVGHLSSSYLSSEPFHRAEQPVNVGASVHAAELVQYTPTFRAARLRRYLHTFRPARSGCGPSHRRCHPRRRPGQTECVRCLGNDGCVERMYSNTHFHMISWTLRMIFNSWITDLLFIIFGTYNLIYHWLSFVRGMRIFS